VYVDWGRIEDGVPLVVEAMILLLDKGYELEHEWIQKFERGIRAGLSSMVASKDSHYPLAEESLLKLANSYDLLEEYALAETLIVGILKIREHRFGSRLHPEVLPLLNGIGNNYVLQARYADAEGLLLECISALRVSNALDVIQVYLKVKVLNNLGLLYHRWGNFTRAEEFYLEQQAEFSNPLIVSPTTNAGIANSKGNYGVLCIDCGRLEEGRAIVEQAIGVLESLTTTNPKWLRKFMAAKKRADELIAAQLLQKGEEDAEAQSSGEPS
jgi:tetratricopeptide (TPR) repeat protein